MHSVGGYPIYCPEVIKISYLSDLVPGEAAFINKIENTDISRRLYELGFIGGTFVECVAKAPFKGPSAYLVRGSVIALRTDDARLVNVQRAPYPSACGRYKKWD